MDRIGEHRDDSGGVGIAEVNGVWPEVHGGFSESFCGGVSRQSAPERGGRKMLLTKTEARGKWCCQARLEAVRQVDRNIMIPCITDSCMAWRWGLPSPDLPNLDKLVGYCGLAGPSERG
ncbi:MAG: hypothetical protein HQM00_16895 [Magnetococcales bacterium]|nr:hypothetical protein [Magnetococcales bacterium]